jgi:hypothetical protein
MGPVCSPTSAGSVKVPPAATREVRLSRHFFGPNRIRSLVQRVPVDEDRLVGLSPRTFPAHVVGLARRIGFRGR